MADKKNQEKEKTKGTDKEKTDKKSKKEDDFRYIIRLKNTDIDGHKNIVQGLAEIKGIGRHLSFLVADKIGIDRNKKFGNLTDDEIEEIKKNIDNISDYAPGWMLNHRKDFETGEDIHLIGSDLDMRIRDEINIMKKIKSYKGVRHERDLPVRGQRTRGNKRSGLTVGVSRKAQLEKKKKQEEE